MKEYGEVKTYGFNVFRWIKEKFQRRKGWGSVSIDLSGLDENEEEQ